VTYSVVNLAELNVFPAGETVTPELLRAHGFVRRATDPIKVLGDGELTTKLAIHAQAFSASAKRKDYQGGWYVRGCCVRGFAGNRHEPIHRSREEHVPHRRLAEPCAVHAGPFGVYRIGAHIPTPGINASVLEQMFQQSAGSVLGIFDLFSGGNFRKLTIFALGIMPYITSSIILQLMTVVFPYLERLQKEGELGRRKITQYTRYLTIVLEHHPVLHDCPDFAIAAGPNASPWSTIRMGLQR